MPVSLRGQRSVSRRAAGHVALLIGVISAAIAAAADPPRKNLILPGEVFEVAGRTAFLFAPTSDAEVPEQDKPWIL